MPKIAIFGSGLSAAYIYAACKDNSCEVEFFTDRPFTEKVEFFMPIRLSWLPEWVEVKKYPIWWFGLGTKEDYLARMGRTGGTTAFPEKGRTELTAYNPSDILEKLQPVGSKVTLGKFSDSEIEKISNNFDHSFVTFPLQQSKKEGKLVSYWIYFLKNFNDMSLPNIAIYSGTTEFHWTRFSHYWGIYMWEYSHLEYPGIPPQPSVFAEAKKIFDIAPGVKEYISPFSKVTMVGRWARWSKNVLAEDAYKQADKILKELK
jgi:hypothetical protein